MGILQPDVISSSYACHLGAVHPLEQKGELIQHLLPGPAAAKRDVDVHSHDEIVLYEWNGRASDRSKDVPLEGRIHEL